MDIDTLLRTASVQAVAAALIATCLALGFAVAPAAGQDYTAWAQVLGDHQVRGGVDYAALHRDTSALDRFLVGIAEVDPEGMSDDEQLAFWMNAYNAVAVRFVLDRYPEIRSVKDYDGFFNEFKQRVGGRDLTLDEIEDEALAFDDERVHFAVICAAQSCPELRAEPYVGGEVDRQLADQTRRFLSDSARGLRLVTDSDTVWLSSIFMWYAGDFTGGSTVVAFFMRGGVLDWILEHAPPAVADELKESDPKIRYLDYDWSLNDRPAD